VHVVSLGYRSDLALLQLGGTTVSDGGDHLVIRTPDNPTYWWGNFLLLAEVPAPADCQSWLDRFAVAFPEAQHVSLGFDRTDGRATDLDWFGAHGFTAEAQTVMTATDVRPPARGVEAVYRELHSDHDWAQSIELRLRCDTGELDSEAHRRFVTVKAQTNRRIVDAGGGAWWGAFVDDRLVSQMGLLAVGPGLARFQSVETDPDFRRRGLAGSLVYATSRYGFDRLGARTLVMVADPDYFAIDLYRSVGFVATETQLQVERVPR
jgi:ribosomal protein S18 acetylase RimI-like enzyme